ncbi:hypothetical protein FRX31_034307, partial [Thalictrum thalictroides]
VPPTKKKASKKLAKKVETTKKSVDLQAIKKNKSAAGASSSGTSQLQLQLGKKKGKYYPAQDEVYVNSPLGTQSSTTASTPIPTQVSQTNQATTTNTLKRKTPSTPTVSVPSPETVLRISPTKGKTPSSNVASKPTLPTQKNPKNLGMTLSELRASIRTKSFNKVGVQ